MGISACVIAKLCRPIMLTGSATTPDWVFTTSGTERPILAWEAGIGAGLFVGVAARGGPGADLHDGGGAGADAGNLARAVAADVDESRRQSGAEINDGARGHEAILRRADRASCKAARNTSRPQPSVPPNASVEDGRGDVVGEDAVVEVHRGEGFLGTGGRQTFPNKTQGDTTRQSTSSPHLNGSLGAGALVSGDVPSLEGSP